MFVPLTPIRCLYRGVDLYGAKMGIVCADRRFTYAQFGERCERLAGGLLAEGVRAEDRVAFLSFNNHQLLEGYFGVPLAGATVMPLNVRLTPPELVDILNHSGARILLFENDFAPLVEQFRKVCPAIERYVALNSPVPAADITYEELLDAPPAGPPGHHVLRRGRHRGTVLYQRQHRRTQGRNALPPHPLPARAHGTGGEPGHDDTDVELHTIPLFHANALGPPPRAPP